MAAAADEALEAPPAKKPAGKLWLVGVLVVTLLGAAGGFLVGKQIVAMVRTSETKAKSSEPAALASPYAGTVVVKELKPIVTNLVEPDSVMIRLQAALVYDTKAVPEGDALAAQIGDDMLAYVKTLTASQIQGASGLQQLKEDLTERASLRSDGKIREVVIETLVVQ